MVTFSAQAQSSLKVYSLAIQDHFKDIMQHTKSFKIGYLWFSKGSFLFNSSFPDGKLLFVGF